MAKVIIAEGKTTNEAINNGLKQLHTTKENVTIKVLEEEKRMFFSILTPRVVKVEMTLKENAKTELNLRKRLVEVEIANFKSKKESAVNPLVDDFIIQASNGKKTKDELKQYADNILLETKNGPPYVYT